MSKQCDVSFWEHFGHSREDAKKLDASVVAKIEAGMSAKTAVKLTMIFEGMNYDLKEDNGQDKS